MIQLDLNGEINQYIERINLVAKDITKLDDLIAHLKTPLPIIEDYLRCLEDQVGAVNKKKKELDKKISAFLDEYKFIDTEKNVVKKWREKQDDIYQLNKCVDHTTHYIQSNIDMVLEFLCSQQFIAVKETEEEGVDGKDPPQKFALLEKGQVAVHLREVHCLVFANFYQDISLLSSKQIIIILSCFTNISVSEDFKELAPKSEDPVLQRLVEKMKNDSDHYLEKEYDFNTGSDYTFHYDLLNYIGEWAEKCNDEGSCKIFLQKLEREKDIFLGEFVKALLKITNIATELEQIAELQNNLEFLSKLKEIPAMLLKYVVTNQSLYV
jgi:hypothetical protein